MFKMTQERKIKTRKKVMTHFKASFKRNKKLGELLAKAPYNVKKI